MISIKHANDPALDPQYLDSSVHSDQDVDKVSSRKIPCKETLQEALSHANKLLDEAEKISRKLS